MERGLRHPSPVSPWPAAPEPAEPGAGCVRARCSCQGRIQSHFHLAGQEDQQVAGLQGEGLAGAASEAAGRPGAGSRQTPGTPALGSRMLRAPAGEAPQSLGSWTFMALKCFSTIGQHPFPLPLSLLPLPRPGPSPLPPASVPAGAPGHLGSCSEASRHPPAPPPPPPSP